MATQIFVNIPVKDLNKSIGFFTKLGFTFDQRFTDENATCMIISDNIFAMLLVEIFFKTFTNKKICDTSKDAEAILALATDSRANVDKMISKVLKAGGTESHEAHDEGWIYGRSFQDIDGHFWEVFHMDEPPANA